MPKVTKQAASTASNAEDEDATDDLIKRMRLATLLTTSHARWSTELRLRHLYTRIVKQFLLSEG